MFCPLPWIFMGIRNNGDVRICCQANQGPDKGLLRKKDGTIYNAAKDDLIESRNCDKLKQVRLDFLNNKWHPDCIRCQREEASDMRSRFTYEKELWNHYFNKEDAKKLTTLDGSINVKEVPTVYYDLRFGNKCNIACRTCSPTDSDAWYKEHVKVFGNVYHDTSGKMIISKVDGKYQVDKNIYKWYKNEHFWDYLKTQIPHIQLVHMVGGEPLIIDEQFRFLEECITQEYAHKIRIEHNSNIVYIPKRAWELWKHFKVIQIGVSIDGIGKVNDYIRYPSKWDKIYNNLLKFENSKEGNFRIWPAVTVNIFNIIHLPKMFEWIIDQDFKNIGSAWQPIASLHPLHAPKYLNIKILPIEVKHKIKKYFDEYKFTKHEEKAKQLLNQYSNFMFQEDNSHELKNFFEITDKIDKIRNQKLEDYIPELYELIKDYK